MYGVDEEPTAEVVLTLAKHLEGVWSRAHVQWSQADTYYNRTYDVWPQTGVAKNRSFYRPSTPTNIIDHAVDNQLAIMPRFHREPVGRDKDTEERSGKIENWLVAAFTEMSLLEPSLIWKQVGKFLTLYGYASVKGPLLVKPHMPVRRSGEQAPEFDLRMERYEDDKNSIIPFRLSAIHPAQILLPPLDMRPTWGIEHTNMYAYDIEALVARKRGKRAPAGTFAYDKEQPFRVHQVTQYWSVEWHSVVVEGELLYNERNAWGYIPFTHGYAGYGMETTDSDAFDPAELAVGMLNSSMDSIKAQAQARSAQQNALILAAYRKRATRNEPVEMAEQLAQSDILHYEPGDMWWEEIPNLPNSIFQTDLLVDQDIEHGTYARNLAGQPTPGVTTVGQEAMQRTSANRKFISTMVQMDRMATIVASNLLRLLTINDETITVHGISLSPKDIAGDYNIQAQFKAVDPILALQARELGLRERAVGAKSLARYWREDSELEDVAGERKELMKERIRQHPAYINAAGIEIAKEMGLDALVDELMAAQPPDRDPGSNGPLRQPISPDAPVLPGQPRVKIPPQGV